MTRMDTIGDATDSRTAATVASDLAAGAGERRMRTEEQLRGVVSMLAHFIWHRRTRPGDHMWSIPVDRERDWDCILTDAIDELVDRRRAAGADAIAPLVVSTLVPSEYREACAWRDAWLDAEDDVKPPMLDAQIVAYLVADAEQLRKINAALSAEKPVGEAPSLTSAQPEQEKAP